MNSGIYEIVNLVNGKRYVGSAVDMVQRWREHRWGLNGNRHGNKHLQASWAKHGEQSFAFVVLELCEPSQLIEREQAAIDRLKPDFNICPTAGSTFGRSHTESAKAKIAAKALGRKHSKPRGAEWRAKLSAALRGKSKSEEFKQKNRDAHLGKRLTPDHRAKISSGGRRAYENGTRAREKSPEHRAKIAETLRNKSMAPDVRAKLRRQAEQAWSARSNEERRLHMEIVRAARRQQCARSE